MSVLSIEHVVARGDRLTARVRVVDAACMRTSSFPGLVDRLRVALPGIARHRCECGSSRGVLAELADTETPHLLEHVTLEVMALAGWPRATHGETTWDFARDGRGVFEVSVCCEDEPAAHEAFDIGGVIVDHLCGAAPLPDIDAEVARLSGLRRRHAAANPLG